MVVLLLRCCCVGVVLGLCRCGIGAVLVSGLGLCCVVCTCVSRHAATILTKSGWNRYECLPDEFLRSQGVLGGEKRVGGGGEGRQIGFTEGGSVR